MKLNDLQIFVDIVEAGALTAAAKRRGVSQPALSRILRDLEFRLQTQLLHRTGHGIELTSAGQGFLNFSIETLQKYDALRNSIQEHSTKLPSHLNLSLPLRVGRLLIPDLYRNFSEKLPDTDIHIFEESSERAQELLADGQLDAAITYRSLPKQDREFIPLYSEKFYAVGNNMNLGSLSEDIEMLELSKLPLLLPSTGQYRTLIQTAFRSAGYEPNIARELETAEGLLAFASEGEGIAILPFSNFFKEANRNEVVSRLIINEEIVRTIGLQIGSKITKRILSSVLPVIKSTLRKSAQIARWYSLSNPEAL